MPRDPSHFDHLIRLLEMERSAEKARFADLLKTLPLEDLEKKGLVLLDLEVCEDELGLGGRFLLTFERPDRAVLPARVYPGDLIEVRPRRSEEMESARGIVSRATRTKVQVAFDRPPPPWISEGRLRLDLIPNDVTFDRARTATLKVKGMDRGQERHTREVLLGNEAPKFNRVPELTSELSSQLTSVRPLNPEQRRAVEKALGAEDFFLVHGPPGTGKSTVLAEVAVQSVRSGMKLLATAASNAAVDHLLELCLGQGLAALRVGHPARVAPHLQEHTLDIRVEDQPDRKVARELFDEAFALQGYARKQRKQGRSRERFANARESAQEARKLIDEARALEKKAVRAELSRAQVICATLASLDSGPLSGETFDLALFDEATQAIEPTALAAFLKAPRVILAGDHQQLPATVISLEAARGGLSKSLFERLLEDHGEDVKVMLAEQYRMNERIMSFPSREMYGGKLRAHASAAQRTLAEVLKDGASVDAPPVLFLDTAGKGFDESQPPGSESRQNEGEAALVVARARELLDAGLPEEDLAVITPYSAQAELIRDQLGRERVEVDTVDAFQGREKEAILISLVRSNSEGNLGFLADLRRMNVALTRGKRHVFVVGDSATLGGHAWFSRLIESVTSDGGYRSGWEWPDPTAV